MRHSLAYITPVGAGVAVAFGLLGRGGAGSAILGIYKLPPATTTTTTAAAAAAAAPTPPPSAAPARGVGLLQHRARLLLERDVDAHAPALPAEAEAGKDAEPTVLDAPTSGREEGALQSSPGTA